MSIPFSPSTAAPLRRFGQRMAVAAKRIVPPAWLIFMFSVSGLFLRRYVGEIPAVWIGVLSLISFVITAWVSRSQRACPAALLPLVALTVTGGIATVFGVEPIPGTIYLILWGATVLMWWQTTLMPVHLARRATFAVMAAFALLGLYEAVIWALLHGAGRGGLITRPIANFPSPNHLGAAIVAGMALALKEKRWFWLGVMVITLALTGSRGAMLGALAGGAAYAVWWMFGQTHGSARMDWLHTRRSPQWVIIGMVVAILLIGGLLFAVQWQNATHAGPQFRVDLWQAAARTFLDHPINGIGLENYRYGFLKYATLQHERIHEQAHSVVLQVAAEQGVIGLGALALLVGVIGRTLLDLHRRGERRQLVILSVFFAAMAVQGLFDHVYEALINALVVMLVAWSISRPALTTASPAYHHAFTADAPGGTARLAEKRGESRIAAVVIGMFVVALAMAGLTLVWPHILMPFTAAAIFLSLESTAPNGLTSK